MKVCQVSYAKYKVSIRILLESIRTIINFMTNEVMTYRYDLSL